jgi:lipopolysaccharide biosynthesis glycosyltransferase
VHGQAERVRPRLNHQPLIAHITSSEDPWKTLSADCRRRPQSEASEWGCAQPAR